MQRQAVIEKHIEDDPCITPPRHGETLQRGQHQGVAISVGIDLPVQADAGLQLGAEATFKPAFDEIAIQAAKPVVRALAAQVQVREIIHAAELSIPIIPLTKTL